VCARQLDDVIGQPVLVGSTVRHLALRRAVLPECAAGAALGYAERLAHKIDALAAARRAQTFPRPASARIILSSVRPDTARRRSLVLGLELLQPLELITVRSVRTAEVTAHRAPCTAVRSALPSGTYLQKTAQRLADMPGVGDIRGHRLVSPPPLIFTPEQCDEIVDALGEAIEEFARETA
jgi:hypothetical protein